MLFKSWLTHWYFYD